MIIEIFAGTARITSHARMHEAFGNDGVLDPWDILYGARYNLLDRRCCGKLFRILDSGHVLLA